MSDSSALKSPLPEWCIDRMGELGPALDSYLTALKTQMVADAKLRGAARWQRIHVLAEQLPKNWRAEWLGSEGWTETLPQSAISLRLECNEKYTDLTPFVRLLAMLQREDFKRYALGR